ncbi:peroxiredoxin [Thalassotalea sp. 1_MG-2023]|uniref:peroxiredoxin n=1 Tax=Thalassotalea sp. 1_MG-2023 TaxID=3062680 RepID=UPI0026E383E5|nr:peroxiredoxin [Thalassotalea sp. 1_MG-2023]MDO6425372.1 peroxiredoxin [Thalassotalea sp. 1_MG-2023]
MINVNQQMPSGKLHQRTDNDTITHQLPDLFAGKKVVLFAVPGAFTPTCSDNHLPSFIALADQIKAKGVDEIICIAVNDVFVMKAWQDVKNAEHITMLSDADGSYTRSLGLGVDMEPLGGFRSRRYAMIIDNGTVVHLATEEAGELSVSGGESILQNL